MLIAYIRALVIYLVLVGAVRLMGKRQVGQLEPSEFVVTMLIANLAAIPIQEGSIPLFSGLIPILTVLAMELVLSFLTLRSLRLRRLLCGKPVILIDNGRLLQHRLRMTRISLDELRGHLRLKEVLDIRQVQYAILETNGELSVFLYPGCQPAGADDAGIRVPPRHLGYTVIQDGVLFPEDLRRAGKDTRWLQGELDRRGVRLKDTLLLTVEPGGGVTFLKKEGRG